MKRSLWCALVLAALAQIAAAQDPVASAVSSALGTFAPPSKACDALLKGGDFRVSSGKSYYKTAMEQSDTANRTRILHQAQSNLVDAIGAGQGKLATTWYWLAKTDMGLGDLNGADTAYKKTLEIAPGCKPDVDNTRQLVWYRLLGNANDKQKAGDMAGAMMYFRGANRVYTDSPIAYLSLGALFSQAQQNDSALYYFELAAKAPYTASDTNQVSYHNQALYNTGVMQIGIKQWDQAIASFHAYVAANPDDPEGKKGLAQAFIGAGKQDSAQAILSSIGMGAGSASAGKNPIDSTFQAGVAQFNAKDYKAAQASFAAILQQKPYLREALYNRANTELALKDGPALTASAKTLMAAEPFNDKYASLAAGGFQLTKNNVELNKLGVGLAAWPIGVEITEFAPGVDSSSVTGTATGRDPKDPAGKALKPVPVTLIFEFFDEAGTTVVSKEVALPALTSGQTSPVQATGVGKGIVGWRYHRK